MIWILSTLHALHGSVQRCTVRAFLPLLLVILSVLSGAACRDDQVDAPRGKDAELDDSDASPVAGAIQGSFAVSSTGEATYALPLIIPPGAAGMQPSLAIAYSSASGDGMLGMGFSLSGLSAITRCSRTMAQDNQIRSVRYDQHDALCLDGARLVPVGSSGDGVVEYRTVPDTFVKVLSFPSKVLENPADTLKVFTRSGLVLAYGSAPDASGARVMGRAGVIRSWLVQRVSDRSENTIAYEYLNFTARGGHTTEYVPFRILLATAQHTFTLHDTGVPRPKHLIDEKFQLNNREASAHLADVNGDGIADLVQCERDESAGGADAFLWTLRLWTPAGPGFSLAPRTMPGLTFFHCAWEIRTVDINADGKVDLVLPDLGQNQAIPLTRRIALTYDEQNDTWENEQIGTLGPSQGSPLFLDVNGDGLPDVVKLDGTTGQPVTVLNTGDSHGGRFGAEVRGVKEYIPGDLAALWSLAAALDYNGDGLQDVLVPMQEGDGLLSWVILRSVGDGTFALVETAIPFDAELSAQGVTIHNRLGPRITDVDGDGTPDVLLPIGNSFNIFRSVVVRQDLLAGVHDGLNAHDPADPGNVPTLLIEYGTLIDKAITDGVAAADDHDYVSKGWFAPSCAYPLRCVVGPRQVVREYSRNNGADKLRSTRVQYRGGRYDRRGRGFLGFQAKITTDLDTGSGNLEIYGDALAVDLGTVKTYPEAGQLREAIRWTLNPRPQDPDRIELSFTTLQRELRATNGGATYFLMPTEVSQARKQGKFSSGGVQSLHQWLVLSAKAASLNVAGSTVATTDYDNYGNVLAAVTTTAEVDLTTTISGVKFNNFSDSWIIGQLATRTECSTAANLTQCRTVARTYDDTTGLLKDEIVDAEGDATMHLAITYGRDAFGNITSATADDKLGNHRATWTTYEPSGVFPDKHGNAVGHVVVPAFDAGLGVMTSLVDENQLTTTWKYDGFGRRTPEIRPDSTETRYTLIRTKDGGPDQNEWNVKATTITKGGEDSAVQYDSLARPIRWWIHGIQTGHDPPPRILQEIAFDDLGEHIARRSTPVDEAVPPESRHYDEYAYDPTGRLLTHTTPWSAVTSYEYEGKLVHATDPFNKVTTTESDALGRLVTVTDAEGGLTSYAYGPFGALSAVTDPGKAVTSTLRDAYGRVRTSIDPDKGTTILGYDGFNELTSTLDAQGRTAKFFYDPLGRRTRCEDTMGNSPALVTTWTWDTAPLGVSGKLALGALGQVESPDGTASVNSYDKLGRLGTIVRSIGDELFGTSFTYDRLGRVATISYPEAVGLVPFKVKNEYDPYGHLTKVWNPASGSSGDVFYWQLAGTDSADRITVESFGNGFTTKRTYFDEENRVKSITTIKGAELVQALDYVYDAKLNLRSRHDGLQSKNTDERFRYDALDRLTCSTFSPASICPTADSYTYAPDGNLLTKPGIAGTYAYDLNHPHAVQTAGADSFTYDLVGNQTTRSGAAVSYTAFDMPKAFTPPPGQGGAPVTLEYDGHRRRVRKTAGDDVTVYVGEMYERTSNATTGAIEYRYFVHGNERVVAVVTRSSAPVSEEKTRYLHVDNLGSVETVTDETGSKAAAEKRSYDAFGARRNPLWGAAPVAFSSLTTRGSTGHEDDEELGLINMKGRLYDPKVGRFLTTDPIVSHPSFGQSWNPYSYVLNNPLKFVDPSGFETTDTTYSNGTRDVVFDPDPVFAPVPIGPPPSPPPPNVDASRAGLTDAPTNLGATGKTTASTPQPPADGGGGAGGAGPDPWLSAGGGGSDSGARAAAALHPEDDLGMTRNLNEQAQQYGVTALLAPVRYPVVVGVIAFGLLNPDPKGSGPLSRRAEGSRRPRTPENSRVRTSGQAAVAPGPPCPRHSAIPGRLRMRASAPWPGAWALEPGARTLQEPPPNVQPRSGTPQAPRRAPKSASGTPKSASGTPELASEKPQATTPPAGFGASARSAPSPPSAPSPSSSAPLPLAGATKAA